ncbi:hypothetical protein [Hymenobacter glaciei]|uniref:hypothetical protein n=1 Tax=Hymenobacter glaciei TaxID=877209 RepID=UPI0031E63EEA
MTMTLRLLTLALLTGSTFVLTECRKKADPSVPQLTKKEEMLTTPVWIYDNSRVVQTTAAGVATSSPFVFDPCSSDDRTQFHADRKFTIDEGPLVCTQRQSVTGTWALASNETELVMTNAQSHVDRYRIANLTTSTLSYVFSQETYQDGSRVEVIANFSAK